MDATGRPSMSLNGLTTDTDTEPNHSEKMKIQLVSEITKNEKCYITRVPEKMKENLEIHELVFLSTVLLMTELNSLQQGLISFPFSRFIIFVGFQD